MTKKAQHLDTMRNIVRRLQENGPATSEELAGEFGLPTTKIGSMMGYLGRIGAVVKLDKPKQGHAIRFDATPNGLSALSDEKRKAVNQPRIVRETPTFQSYNDAFWDAFLRKSHVPKPKK